MEHGVAELFEAACPARCARHATSGLRNSRRRWAKTPSGLPFQMSSPGARLCLGPQPRSLGAALRPEPWTLL